MTRTRDPLVEQPVDLEAPRSRGRAAARLAVAAVLLIGLVAGTCTSGGVAGAEADPA
ncbi:MAG: hypothetical protein JNK12_17300 [Acidimicrobiales bacterium]|nr:hypothetical protein [Acidimicrobiales bacterium]